jgi:hypothetical protein
MRAGGGVVMPQEGPQEFATGTNTAAGLGNNTGVVPTAQRGAQRCEFKDYLAEMMLRPAFRTHWYRLQRKHEQGHWFPVPVKPSQHRRGWRRP